MSALPKTGRAGFGLSQSRPDDIAHEAPFRSETNRPEGGLFFDGGEGQIYLYCCQEVGEKLVTCVFYPCHCARVLIIMLGRLQKYFFGKKVNKIGSIEESWLV